MANLRSFELDKFLNTSASSPGFVPALDSYLHNVRGKQSAPGKVKFFINTTDINGNAVVYRFNGQNIVGLTLTINPSSINVNFSKIVNRTQTMVGWLEEHWGEELDTISLDGSGAAFIWGGPQENMPVSPIVYNGQQYNAPVTESAAELRQTFNRYANITDLGTANPAGTGDQSGLTVSKRRDTVSYQEFKYLMQFMNANAATYDIHGFVSDRKYIQLTYDYAAYRGYFESLDITENAETPYRFNYALTFKAEKTVYRFFK